MEFFEVKFDESFVAGEFKDTKHRFSCQPGGCHRNAAAKAKEVKQLETKMER